MWRPGWLLIALLPLACGTSDDGEPRVAPDVSLDAPASADGTPASQVALPLTSLLRATRTNDLLIQAAAHADTAACMSDQGLMVPAIPPSDMAAPEPDRPFGPWDESDVVDGYGGHSEAPRFSALERYVESLSPSEAEAWGLAYYGSDSYVEGPRLPVVLPDGSEVESGFATSLRDGCYFRGMDAVFGDYAYREELRQEIEELVNQAYVDAEQHDLVDQALRFWKACMEDGGVDVSDGVEGPQELALEFLQEPGISKQERTVALLDVGCKEEANLHDAYFVARTEIEEELIEDNQLFVEAWRELVDDSLAKAREIVSRADG